MATDGEPPAGSAIGIASLPNLRDLGGWRASDGRAVRRGRVLRSVDLSRLEDADIPAVAALGIGTVVDLRTEKEHNKSPTVWLGDNPPRFLHFPIGDAENDWFRAQSRMDGWCPAKSSSSPPRETPE